MKKEEAYNVLKGLGLIIALYAILGYLQLGIYWTYAIVLGLLTFYKIYKKKFTAKGFGKSALYLAGIFAAFDWLGGFGWYGYLVGVLILCGILLWKRRENYIQVKHRIEKEIWGKPLKDFVHSNEKVPKVKISGWR